MHLTPDPPAPPPLVCVYCSKPIRRSTGISMRGNETLHPRCLARAVQLEAMELQAKAKGLREEATDRSQRAHQLIEEGVRLRTCPVCYDLLSVGTGLLYAGEQLVHARCWPAEPPAA
jgi:hypothetical protein